MEDSKQQMPDNVPKNNRGRYGIRGSSNRSGDFNRYLFLAKTHDYILFFTNNGRAYMLRGYQIPEAGRQAKGSAVMNLLPLRPEEKITAVINVHDFEDTKYLVMATDRGTVKRCRLAEFSSVRKNGIKAVTLHDGEELIGVKITDGNNSILLGTRGGMAIHFDEQDVRCMSRKTHGVAGIDLHEADCVVAMDVVRDDAGYVLSVTENGIGKRTAVYEFKKQKRAGRGRIGYKLTAKTGSVAGLCIVHADDEVFLFTAKGYVLCVDVDGLRTLHRAAKGVIMMRLREGDKVTAIWKGTP
jgi:DNA gyrase subunit A